ncbi:hypothetical protein STCU_07612 [Strigomonas culicis]|uniref:Fungal lipase-type domain-containing protein n=1 Tax=Strigomonas culicis TaxID=28005 RepID=S9U3Z6_9TRYP|nr:hypothetical protein STCU_07612 [Strigomonas culicis]|eukprot:EPY23628.1 hypothetical protein STCU_07612 [Strigomonas culicis]
MSLRQASIRAYRALLRATHTAAANCATLQNKSGLMEYVGARFQSTSDTHRRRLTMTLGELEQRERQALQQAPSAKRAREVASRAAQQRRQILSQYEQFVSQEIDKTLELAAMLPEASDHAALTSMLQVLAAGVGSHAYQRTIETGFYQYFNFERQRAARNEVDDAATSEYQNRLLLHAVLPYAERLLLLHRTAVGAHNRASPLLYLTPWQMTEAVVGTRSGVTAHHMPLGRDHVLVEIDETYNKQILYIACTRGADCDTGSYNWFQEVERVEVGECEELRRTLLHAEYLVMASRLCDSLLQETPVHPTRKTVLIGHGVGGALALLVGLLLAQRGYDITNTISLGSPKALVGQTLQRYVAAVNPLRVVLEGDPLVELPVTGADGDPVRARREILLLGPRRRRRAGR